MTALGIVLVLVGMLVVLGSGIWMLVVAFQRHILWGLAVLFLPFFAALVFLFVAWGEAKKPFLYCLLGTLLLIGGGVLLPWQENLQKLNQQLAALERGTPQVERFAAPQPPSLEERLAALGEREKVLRERKAALLPSDHAGALALKREIDSYNVELEQVLALQRSTAVPSMTDAAR